MKKLVIAFALFACSPLFAKRTEKALPLANEDATHGYLMSYILQGETTRTNAFFVAYSKDGAEFTAMNNNKALVYPLLGTKKIRQPWLFRKADTGFGLITTDNNLEGVLIYHSPDLITYHDETYLKLGNGVNIVDICCNYDNDKQAYSIKWRTENGTCYESFTKDFKNLETAKEIPPFTRPAIIGTKPQGSLDHSVIQLTKTEYERVTNKYAKVTNTGIAPIEAISVRKGKNPSLPNRVTAQYSDGSTKQMGVKWEEADLKAINLKKPGKYVVKGTIQQPEYTSPLISQRADPWIFKGDDDYYYFTASYPMVGHDDPNGYDRVILRRAKTIAQLSTAEEISIWHEKDCPTCHRYVWAPEIHQIDGTWFVFFTTSLSDNVWHIRPRIIACNKGERDPYNPECWEEVGHTMDTVEGDNHSCNHFSLDKAYFADLYKSTCN